MKGFNPMLEVLEIGRAHDTRQADDLLPHLPAFRALFDRLSRETSSMRLSAVTVAFGDLECITQTTIKVRPPVCARVTDFADAPTLVRQT